ncbi:MAG: response regulator [Enterobacterales bacterium]|nr:response regulator [Enterobacterales bacterium]
MNEWGIKARVIMLALIPTAIVAIVMGTYFVSARVQDLNINVQDRGITVANYLAQTSEYSLLSRNSKTLSRLVTSARDGDDDILAIAVYTKNNLLLASSGTKSLVKKLANPNNNLLQQTFIKEINEGFIIKAPVVSQPTHSNRSSQQSITDMPIIGYVSVMITNKNIKLRQMQTLVTAFVILMVGLILGGILALNMARNITLPIIQLANAVKRIKEGQLKVEIKSNSSGDLKTLVEGFNDMSISLYEAREEMQVAIEQAVEDINSTNLALEEQNVELILAKKHAVEASRVKSEFLANMSHEIRTPMNGVIGFTNMLLRSELSEKQKDYLSTIKKSANSLLDIIDDILDFSKIEAGKMEIENRSLSISNCVDESLNLLAPTAQAKNIEILGIVYQDVPQSLKGDAGKIGQILNNLCNNAIKFTQKGTIQIRVMLEEEYPDAVMLKINITDTGVGLSPEQQKVLFHAFTQADTTTTRRFGGTGLGLVISKKLAESMQGKIGLESKEGIGSTFWFTIKLEKDFEAIESQEMGFPGRPILLHDKSNQSQLATKYLLNRWHTAVQSADSMADFIVLVEDFYQQNKQVDLILVGGYLVSEDKESLLKLQQLSVKLKTPLAVLINTQEDKIIHQFLEIGINEHLSKPITRKSFYDALYDWFSINNKESGGRQNSSKKPLGSLRAQILCVDDNESNLKLIEAFLSEFNVDIQVVASGREAIKACKQRRFDIIFMDIQMPEMDGIQATKRIKRINDSYASVPIIALTAHAMKGEKERLLNSGMDDYLTKPINHHQLQETIQKWTKKEVFFCITNDSDEQTAAGKAPNLAIDWQMSLKKAGNREHLAKDMLRMLVESFDEAKWLIQKHLDSEDLENLTAQVHRIHGATAYCGVPKLKNLAEQYETLLKTKGICRQVKETHKEFSFELDKVEKDAGLILEDV